ncbi:MAG TPA: hypothetical protein VGJ93_14550 [Desulfuromonadaceae bacterium]|jgi:hypothetical protein
MKMKYVALVCLSIALAGQSAQARSLEDILKEKGVITEEGKTSGRLLRAHGFYAQTGYLVIPKHLELAIRYSWMDPNRDSITSDLRSELTGAISYYFDRHNLKLQGDISNTHDQSTSFSDDMTYRGQAQLLF